MTPVPIGGFDAKSPEKAAAAHLVRRTALGVDAERVAELADKSWDDAVRSVLDHQSELTEPPARRPDDDDDDGGDWYVPVHWWLKRMIEPDTGLTDRMAWFWHGMLTTSADKVDWSESIADQLGVLRSNARGNFRTLLQSFIHTAALQEYLDSSYSQASNPNENLSRELMELFTVGHGNYTEDDVRGAARALAGWVVEKDKMEFRRENAFIAPLIFQGVQDEWDTTKIVDHLCDQPATAARISARLWHQFVGQPLTEGSAAELGEWWQSKDLEIEPLITRILSDPTFAEGRLNRPRTGLEWFCATLSALGPEGRSSGTSSERAEQFEADAWKLYDLGQMPYQPPNVGGWPTDDRWIGPGSILARASTAFNFVNVDRLGMAQDDEAPSAQDQIEEVVERCALHELSEGTAKALREVDQTEGISSPSAYVSRWRVALSSPEFNLS